MKYLIPFFVLLLLIPVANAQELTPHDPIVIEGDWQFDADHGVVSGSGTAEDPYVIEGWDIDATNSQFGILIEDTTAHFVVRNCFIHDAIIADIGFMSISNGRIGHVTVEGGNKGVIVSSSDNVLISNITSLGTQKSLQLTNSGNLTVRDSALDSAIFIASATELDWATTEFDNVTVGGAPFVYLYGPTGEVSLGEFRQAYIRSSVNARISGIRSSGILGVYISNATDTVIVDSELYDSDSGFFISSSKSLKLNSIKFSNVSRALKVWESGITLENVTFDGLSNLDFMYSTAEMRNISAVNVKMELQYLQNSSFSDVEVRMIRFRGSRNITVRDSKFSNFDFHGLIIKDSGNLTVDNCTFEDNLNDGIQIINSANILITNSTFRKNGRGMEFVNSSGVEVFHNLFYRSRDYAIYIDGDSSGNVVHENTFMYNHYSSDHFDPKFRQAADYGENLWNLTRGNYWTDWTSPDNNGDGIVDNPYPLKGGAKDYRPLTEPPWTPIPEILNPVVIVAVFALCLCMIGKKRNMKKS